MQRATNIRTPVRRLHTLVRSLTTMSVGREKVSAIVIGSGQAGTPLAVALANAGRSTVLIERANLGGTCVNVGCTPTKTMIASGRIAHLAGRASEYGIFQCAIGDGIVTVAQMDRIRERKREIVQRWRSGSEKRVAGVKGLEVIKGEARFITEKVVKVVSELGISEKEIEADEIFINVGERPAASDLQGLETVDASRVLNSTSIMELDVIPQRLLVLGGGYIGMEFGQLFARLKSKVTIVQRGKQLLPREDAEIAQAVQDICQEDGIDVILNATATKVSATGANNKEIQLDYQTSDGTLHRTSGSHLLIATGRTPNTDSLNLSAAGVDTTSRGHVVVEPDLQTNVPGMIVTAALLSLTSHTMTSASSALISLIKLRDQPLLCSETAKCHTWYTQIHNLVTSGCTRVRRAKSSLTDRSRPLQCQWAMSRGQSRRQKHEA